MGSTSSQKSFLIKKVLILVSSLIATGVVMRFFSPPYKLDARLFYSFSEAATYLTALTDLQKREYLFVELFDFWFMINYSWINFIMAKKVKVSCQRLWIAFVPGILDVFETTLIVYFLHYRELSAVHELLPILSSLKWISAIALIIYLLQKGLKLRANH